MSLPKSPIVEVRVDQFVGTTEVGMCPRCGCFGEVGTLCRNTHCRSVSNHIGASSEDLTRASRSAYESAIKVVVAQLEARATALEIEASRWDQVRSRSSVQEHGLRTPRPENYAANVLREEITALLANPLGKTS